MKFDKIRIQCVEKEVSFSKAMNDCNITGHVIMNIAHNRNISAKTLDKLCTYFNCQPCDLMELDDD